MEDFRNEQLAHHGFKSFKSAKYDDEPPWSERRPLLPPPPPAPTVYQPCRDPARVAQVEWIKTYRPDSGSREDPSPKFSLDTQHSTAHARSDTNKTSLLQKVLKRQPPEVDDTRSRKRFKAAMSRHAPDFRKVMVSRARDLAGIMAASAEERQQYEEHKKLTFEQQMEEYYRQHPEHEQIFLVEKQKVLFPGTAYRDLQGPQHYQALVEEHNAEVRQQAGLEADFRDGYRRPMLAGGARPSPPAQGQGTSLELDTIERSQARLAAWEQDGRMPVEQYKGLTASQKVAMGISKVLDPLKKIVKPDEDVDMDEGMFDAAPKDLMDVCDICGQQTQSYLINDVCRFCRTKQRRGWR